MQPEPTPLELRVTGTTMAADGVGEIAIELELSGSVPDGTPVRLKTSLGSFGPADSTGVTTITLRPSNRIAVTPLTAGVVPGAAVVSASYGAGAVTGSVQLTIALPDSIVLSGGPLSGVADGKTAIGLTAVVGRRTGRVSAGLPMEFQVTDSATSALVPGLGGLVNAGDDVERRLEGHPDTLLVVAEVAGIRSNAAVFRFRP